MVTKIIIQKGSFERKRGNKLTLSSLERTIQNENKNVRKIFFFLKNEGLFLLGLNGRADQCFSTGVPQRTSVPWNYSRCAAKSWNVKESMQKSILLTPRCAASFYIKICVTQVQKGWETLVQIYVSQTFCTLNLLIK